MKIKSIQVSPPCYYGPDPQRYKGSIHYPSIWSKVAPSSLKVFLRMEYSGTM